jgi:HK97 family phage portal protein
MGLFEKIFGKAKQPATIQGPWKTLTAYQPSFTSFSGSLYESELVRSAIDARARHISKLKVETTGTAKKNLQTILKYSPNEFQTWSQFLYRLSTILDMQNTAFIVPVFGEYGEIAGFYPVLPSRCDLVRSGNEPWIRYTFNNGQVAAIRVTECGILTKFQYSDDFFGDDNLALYRTMNLISIQNQGIEEAIKNSSTYRFMAQLSNFSKASDLKNERERFTAENLASDANGGGLLLFPNTYTNIQQIQSKAYTVDADQQKLIQTNVFNYYGVNEKILQNIASGDEWSAFYEGAVEPFAVQLSEVLSKICFTQRERALGSEVIVTANRLQYMSNKDKLNVSAQMADRGLMTINEIRDIWQLAPLPDGDVTVKRGEYKTVDYTAEEPEEEDNADQE